MEIPLTKDFLLSTYRHLTQRLFIGEHTYGTPQIFEWGEGASLTIGDYCSIADDVKIFLGGNHRIDWISTYPFSVLWAPEGQIPGHPATKGNVTIGSDVWIGHGATILSGVDIGSGAVIGANAVVSQTVLPYAIVVGNPAKTVKYRFSENHVQSLLNIEWWNWPEQKIRENIKLICSSDVDALLEKHTEDFP